MTLIDAHRKAADKGRLAAQTAGARPTTVSVELRTYDLPVGTVGAVVLTTVTTTLSPKPKVVRAGAGATTALGGGFGALAAGGLTSEEWTIGPITQTYTGGGYVPNVLLPATTTFQTLTIRLTGDAWGSGGESFELIPGSLDASKPHQFSFNVRRAVQV